MFFQIGMFPTQMLILLFISQYNFAFGCKADGSYYCSPECFELFECVNEQPISIKNCTGEKRCNYITKDCKGVKNYGAPGTCKVVNLLEPDVALCGSSGKPVPHNTDCTVYTECNEPRALKRCPDGVSFNPSTRLCDQDLGSDVCKNGLTPICNKTIIGKSGPVDANPQFYWICIKEVNTLIQ